MDEVSSLSSSFPSTPSLDDTFVGQFGTISRNEDSSSSLTMEKDKDTQQALFGTGEHSSIFPPTRLSTNLDLRKSGEQQSVFGESTFEVTESPIYLRQEQERKKAKEEKKRKKLLEEKKEKEREQQQREKPNSEKLTSRGGGEEEEEEGEQLERKAFTPFQEESIASLQSNDNTTNTQKISNKGKERYKISDEEEDEEEEGREVIFEGGDIHEGKIFDIVISDAINVQKEGDPHTVYQVELFFLNASKPHITTKRFRQFAAFHDSLRKHFPNQPLPNFPSRTLPLVTNRMDPGLIESRKVALEKYLKELLSLSPNIFYSFHCKLFFELYDLTGKVAIVTGASSGIGLQTATTLARLKAHVIFACRSKEKTLPIIEKLKMETQNKNLEFLPLDLSSLSSVRQFVQMFAMRPLPIHILINNAGAIGSTDLTPDGFEPHFAVNYLGHFLLTNLLLEDLNLSASAGERGRIVTVTCASHLRAKDVPLGPSVQTPVPWNNVTAAYEAAKLAEVIFTNELALRLEGMNVVANCLHPGLVATDILRSLPGAMSWMMKKFMISPEEGAKTTLYCALAEETGTVSGRYFEDCKETIPNPVSHDRALMTKLWEQTEIWVGLEES